MKLEEKVFVSGQTFLMPAEVKLVTEDEVYFVEPNLIEVAEPLLEESKNFQWFNFRHLTNKGFDPESMNKIYRSIMTDGMYNPIVARWHINEKNELKLQLIDGERRYLSILKLMENDALCWSRVTRDFTSAKEVYETIPCRIVYGNDKESLKVAFSLQENTVDWGEGAKTRVVMRLRQVNCTDDEILEITKRSLPWLRDEDKLAGLDEKTFKYYDEGKINRSVALRLAKIEDEEDRHLYLEEAYNQAIEDFNQSISKIEEEIAKAEEKEEIAEVEIELAKNEDALEEATKDLLDAHAKIIKKKEEKQELEEKGPVAKVAELAEAAKAIEGEGVNKDLARHLRPGKMKKHLKIMENLLQENCIHDGKKIISAENLRMFIAAYKTILLGEEDIIAVLKRQNHPGALTNKKPQKSDNVKDVLDLEVA